jgi:Plasmid pRiA4b ORF-3-like protein
VAHPPIWRQIQVRSDITLGKLHRILQAVMGWTDTHLHQFAIRGKQYWIPDEGDMALRKKIDERKHRLKDVVSRQTSRFTYEIENILSRRQVCVTRSALRAPAPAHRKT